MGLRSVRNGVPLSDKIACASCANENCAASPHEASAPAWWTSSKITSVRCPGSVACARYMSGAANSDW